MLVVFDLDGTLVDSRRDLADASNEMLASYGAPPLPEEVVGRMVGEGAAVLVRRLLDARVIDAPPAEALERFLDSYNGRLTVHTRPYAGIPEALEEIAAFARLALLTNKPAAAAERLLAALGLAAPFERIVGGDSGYPRKPDPAALLSLAAAAGEPPSRTVLIGDSFIDVRTARNAGVHMCVARYGFGFESMPRGELTGNELAVDEPSALPPALRSLLPGPPPESHFRNGNSQER